MLLVNEVFASIQGEATFAGTASVFVRLQGCEVGCPWCDTKYTWPEQAGKELDLFSVTETKTSFGASVSEAWLLLEIEKRFPLIKHIVLTGGEPLAQDVYSFCQQAKDKGYKVQIETSGTYLANIPEYTWLTVSPKLRMKRAFLRDSLFRANEIKMVIGKGADVYTLKTLLAEAPATSNVWVQPLSLSTKATKVCVQACYSYGWKLSLQGHKFAGLR